jgi:hypothetical protein
VQSWQNLELEHIFGTPYSSIAARVAAAGAGTFPTNIAAAAEAEPVNAFTQPQNVYSRAAFVDSTTGKLVSRYGQQTKTCDSTCAAPAFDTNKAYTCGGANGNSVVVGGLLYRCTDSSYSATTWDLALSTNKFTEYPAWVSGFAYSAADMPVLSFGVAYTSKRAVTSTVDPATDTHNWARIPECSASPFAPTFDSVFVSGASTFISGASYAVWSPTDKTAAGAFPLTMFANPATVTTGLPDGTYPIGSKVTNPILGQTNVYNCVNTPSVATLTISALNAGWSIAPIASSNRATLTIASATLVAGTVISGPGITPGTVVLSPTCAAGAVPCATWVVTPSQSGSGTSAVTGTPPCLAASEPGKANNNIWQQIDLLNQQARIDWTCSPGKSVTVDTSTAPTFAEISFKPTLLSQAGNYDVVIASMAFLRGGDFAPSAQTVFNVKSGFRIQPSFIETTGYDRESAHTRAARTPPRSLARALAHLLRAR